MTPTDAGAAESGVGSAGGPQVLDRRIFPARFAAPPRPSSDGWIGLAQPLYRGMPVASVKSRVRVEAEYLAEDTALRLVEKGARMIGVDTTEPDLGGADDHRQSVRSRRSSTRSRVGLYWSAPSRPGLARALPEQSPVRARVPLARGESRHMSSPGRLR
ncbi:hypothetical protein BJF90_08125 [Pseudonocardia sp. CNS-004]|nr:hypothetical protein BJF90_08125 [Pseudonocardia sp. CNS-004]